MVNNVPVLQETRAQSLAWEDALEKDMATHCSVLAWRIPWTEEPVAIVHGVTESDATEHLILFVFHSCIVPRARV